MPEILDHVAYLSQEIGPRPAGTEEEQQAALYITEQFQKEAGLSAVIEDFNGASNVELPGMIASGVAAVVAILAMVASPLVVPAIIVTLIVAVLTVLDVIGKPVLGSAFSQSVSQNVVTQYKPSYSDETPNMRRRKIVLVANYDSGKSRIEYSKRLFGMLPAIKWAHAVASVLLPILLIVRFVGFVHADGAFAAVFAVVTIIVAVVSAVPLFLGIAHRVAPYNDGANCNASGIAVLLDVAARVGSGLVSEAELAKREDAVVHGEEAARAAGVVPDGAVVEYDVPVPDDPDIAERSPEERLAAAKAAVAALTGKPVSMTTSYDISKNLVKVKEPEIGSPTEQEVRELRGETREALSGGAEAAFASGAEAPVPAAEPAFEAEGSHDVSATAAAPAGVPAWYLEAQEKARRTDRGATPRQRSRYADAPSASFAPVTMGEPGRGAAREETPLGARLREVQNDIESVSAPTYARPDEASFADNAEEPRVAAEAIAAETRPEEAPAPTEPAREAAPTAPESPVRADAYEQMATDPEADPEAAASSESASSVPVAEIPLFAAQPDEPEPPVQDQAAARRSEVPRVRVELPDLGGNAVHHVAEAEPSKQRAPLADAMTSGKSAARSLLSMLPSLSGSIGAPVASSPADEEEAKPVAGGSPTSHDRAGMRATLPSLSGSITRQGAIGAAEKSEDEAERSRTAATFGTAGMTGAFAPVSDELLKDADPEELFVEDADDSAYDENFTESGAFAGPGYVEMPKSRVGGLFGRFKRNKGKKRDLEETSTREWLDVDENFDAREVGRARGGWESFRTEENGSQDAAGARDDAFGAEVEPAEGGDTTAWTPLPDGGSWDDDREWDDGSSDGGWDEDEFSSSDSEPEPEKKGRRGRKSHRRWRGGAFSLHRDRQQAVGDEARREAASVDGAAIVAGDFAETGEGEDPIAREMRQIYQFRHPDINTEVWFVALGSELAGHSGMKRFLAEHSQELRGAIVVELDGVGSGDLCYVGKEGGYRKASASSRMGRYVSKASKESGVRVSTTSLPWSDSTASYATSQGVLSMHLAGIESGKVAYAGEKVDSVGNVEEEKLARASDFVIGFLKSI